MTVSNVQVKQVYTADGLNTSWAIPFPYFDDEDIEIYTLDLTFNLVKITSNYSIDEDTAQVIYPTVVSELSPVQAGWQVIIRRTVPLTQLVNLINQGYSNLDTLEHGYDRLTMIAQQLQEQLNRCVQYPLQSSPTSPTPDQLLNLIDAAVQVVMQYKSIYKCVVGAETYCTHPTLAAALADAGTLAGSKILIVDSFSLSTSVTVATANIGIEAMPNVTLSDGGAEDGLIIAASGVRIKGIRFAGFTGNAIQINNTFNNNFISECRFSSCANDVLDSNVTPNNMILGNITE